MQTKDDLFELLLLQLRGVSQFNLNMLHSSNLITKGQSFSPAQLVIVPDLLEFTNVYQYAQGQFS